jgi:DNA-binding IclR family transcriptional regulator
MTEARGPSGRAAPRHPAVDDHGMTGRQPKAATTALHALEEVARHGPGVTAQEIARALDVSAPTAYRLLNLLVGEEYLVRLPDLSGFALGRRAMEFVGTAASAAPQIPRRARTLIARFRSSTRWGVHLITYANGHLHVVDPDPDHPPHDEVFLERNMERCAVGRLLLSDAAATDTAQAGLPQGRHPQYAIQVGELERHLGCVAIAVRDEVGVLIAAIAIAGPADRMTDAVEELLRKAAPVAQELADLLS